MSGFFGRRDNSSRVLGLIGGAAAIVFGATTTTAGASTQHLTQMQIGKRLPTVGYLKAASPVLRTREQMDQYQAAHPSLGLHQANGRPLIPMGMEAYRLAKQLAMQAAHGDKPGTSSAHPTPPTHRALAKAGPAQSDAGNGVFPPDASVAIGGGQITVVVNSTFNVYNRSGVAQLNETLSAFLGGANIVQPRILFDPLWNRWVFLAVDAPSAAAPAFWLAVSKTSNATGQYSVYHTVFPYANGDIWDYPMLGMTQDALLFTGNHFTSNGTTYSGSVLFGVAKARAYNSLGWSAGLATTPTGSGTIAPPVVLDGSDKAYFAGVNISTSTLDVYVGTDFGTTESSFTGSANIAVTGLTIPPNAPQNNTTDSLDTLDGRFEGPSTQFHSGSDVVLWNANTVGSGSFPIPHFYELDATTNTVLQNVVFYESPNSYDFNPSMAVNANSEVFLNWSSTDPSIHQNASVRYSGWQPGDGSILIGTGGVLTVGGPALKSNTESGTVQYWGACSAIALDPVGPASCTYVPNRRAVMINEDTIDYKTWGTEFGIFGFC